ncbi:hypothetical protein AMATHDRAFT_49742 [Amanita thiersii Skay4041]|uniref:Uncharacterized protein n=1 Tax=Amanita thiersii Skay4041 TaxID=703135 RepID=A0A2A9NFT0_9AGAR|nr:hypothetical protein AMATHDRAFT_49742 [Amanita thiersii Skay4041]
MCQINRCPKGVHVTQRPLFLACFMLSCTKQIPIRGAHTAHKRAFFVAFESPGSQNLLFEFATLCIHKSVRRIERGLTYLVCSRMKIATIIALLFATTAIAIPATNDAGASAEVNTAGGHDDGHGDGHCGGDDHGHGRRCWDNCIPRNYRCPWGYEREWRHGCWTCCKKDHH